MPALRDRKDDIPSLVTHFIQHYNNRAGKKVTGISDSVTESLMAYHWPGNIRELENMIERSVLLAKGSIINELQLPRNIPKSEPNIASDGRLKTMEENERDHIINVLTKCKGKIWGTGGAAEILNLPPTTLQSKMKRLGIKKEYIS
jgi:transcriptional regulator with PAS, ATPase and Fis domain